MTKTKSGAAQIPLIPEAQPIKLRSLSDAEKSELEFYQEASELFICKPAERVGILKRLLAMAENGRERE